MTLTLNYLVNIHKDLTKVLKILKMLKSFGEFK